MIIDRKGVFDVFRLNEIREEKTIPPRTKITWTSVEAEYEDAREMFEYLTGTSMMMFLATEADSYLEDRMRASRLIGFQLDYYTSHPENPTMRLLFENGQTSVGYETVMRELEVIKQEAQKMLSR